VIGSYFRNAKVCLDTNNNGVCDSGEAAVVTDSGGQFILPGTGGPVVAEIGIDALQYDPDTGTTVPVASRIVLRAPADATGVVSVESTAVVAEMESNALTLNDAVAKVAAAIGVAPSRVLTDFNKESDPAVKSLLKGFSTDGSKRIAWALANRKPTDDTRRILASATGTLDKIRNVVVIYLENRSFDQLYGLFPGANGIAAALANPASYRQVDRNGVTVLSNLSTAWTALGDSAWSFVATLPNKPFLIAGVPGGVPGKDPSVAQPDLVHRFYNHQMQINGGRNDQFVAWSDAGGLTMGYYDGASMLLWKLAQQYTLADNFFQGAFGGSFLNHFWLVCACTPVWPSPPTSYIASVDVGGTRLNAAPSSPTSALAGPPIYVNDGAVTPKLSDGNHYAINTAEPPYQPSGTPPPAGGDSRLADPTGGGGTVPLPAQTTRTIGDTLTAKNLSWRWYAGSWNAALADRNVPSFEAHHQPFNYFARFNPTTASGAAERAEHLRDYVDLLDDIQKGTLPTVAFYKPQVGLDQHPASATVGAGDALVADLVAKLQAGPQWKNLLVVITYDENGGQWDHVAPPKADFWGPATRVPALIISPFSKKGYVDSVPYDTTSIVKFLTRRFGLEPLPGARAVVSDLSNSLDMMP
jgi:acid phosphatase